MEGFAAWFETIREEAGVGKEDVKLSLISGLSDIRKRDLE